MAVSVPIVFILTRAGLPSIVGFFVTGIIIGPHGFALVKEAGSVEMLAEIGIVLLLFTIGIEFSIKKILDIKREAFIGGGLQVLITIAFVMVSTLIYGLDFNVALILGFIASLSSSAIVLKLLVDRGEVRSSAGNLSVGILIFQDLAVVLMVLVVQGFGKGVGSSETGLLMAKELGKALGAIVFIVVMASYLAPRLFREVVKLKNREVFMLTIVLVCLGTAWAASLFGLSLALGAFVAGLVIAESEYSHQIVAEVLPFRDTFSSLFFISIGMLIEFEYLKDNIISVLAVCAALIAVKTVVIAAVGQILRYPLRLALMVGFNLAQIGEFSFILVNMAEEEHALLGHNLYQLVLSVSVLSMAITPFLFQASPRLAAAIGRILGAHFVAAKKQHTTSLSKHVIIVGYGLNGENLARVLKKTYIDFLVVDINHERVKKARKQGYKAYYGESGHHEILKMLGIDKAKMMVVGITDPVSTRRAVQVARDLNPTVTIIVRTRYTSEVEDLYSIGATQVIPEEFETSVEIFSRVLKEYNIPGNIIQNQIDIVRQEGYAMFRNPSISSERLVSLARILDTSAMESFFVAEDCPSLGKTLQELDIRKRTGGASIMAIIREGKAHTNPRGDFKISVGDILVLIGGHADLHSAVKILNAKEE
ncbi:MAG: cation:proton antiporter [Deltaproteobacteria bacterium]|nr:cation:proton antiporter [Deltaproteobacteria bacterium]